MELGRKIARELEAATFEHVASEGLKNAEDNRPYIGRSVLELRDAQLGTGDTAVVVGAGPSLRRRQSIERLRDSNFPGTIVAADGALGACLRAGVVPHVVVSVDPHPDRIVRWFGDPRLTEVPADDYFRRQEMDSVHGEDELGANSALVDLVDTYGPKIKVAAATSAAPAVVRRCQQTRMELYWWNPMYDDYDKPGSHSRRLWEMNGLPCLNGGGNVGTSAWVLTHAVLGKRRIGLVGIDLGYAPDTPYEKTQYFRELVDLLKARHREAFIHTENPVTREVWFSDPTYHWFREVFLEMARDADCQTFNCTEGGLLFGDGVITSTLDAFLETAAKDHHG